MVASYSSLFYCYCVLAAAAVLRLDCTVALNSRECITKVKSLDSSTGRDVGELACPRSVCGPLDIPFNGTTAGEQQQQEQSFLKRLSPQCQDVMHTYRRADLETPLGLHTKRDEETGEHRGPCPDHRGATTPTNPVVVQAPGVQSFVICTVPKSGCTNLRKLMHAVMNYPSSAPTNAVKAFWEVQESDYPSLWHYDIAPVPADVYPSFIVGRNPYIRLLSGFLDKMIVNERRSDQRTGQLTNKYLGLHARHRWRPSVQHFQRFVHHLAAYSKEIEHKMNIHFQLQSTVCARNSAVVEYEYYLRIEDQAQWFPCWEQGLGLTNFTKQGWRTLPHGMVYVGGDKAYSGRLSSKTDCWWHPPGSEGCEHFYSETRTGWEAGDWDGLSSAGAQAVPWQEEVSVSQVRKSDEHDTAAAAHWKRFYTPEIAEIVYKLYERDFKAFGYSKEIE